MAASEVRKMVQHRPWPLPSGPWITTQAWDDLLFAHWPVPADGLRQIVPSVLSLDTYDGQAWLGVVPFGISGFRPRWFPPIPGLSNFPELNVRTYVTAEDKPGVYFFSLDTNSPLSVAGARVWFHLPYFHAQMWLWQQDGQIHYTSHRVQPGAHPADFVASYRPIGSTANPVSGTLEYFLTERYCLYALDRRQRLYRAEIHHLPWLLQAGECQISTNTMAPPGIQLPDVAPLLHFSRRQDTLIWAPDRVRL